MSARAPTKTTRGLRLRRESADGTLADALAARMRLALLRGDIAPGSKLHLDELKTRFGVSLSPLREALARLAAEGLVEAASQRGFRVPEVSGEGLAEVIALRSHLESLALSESVRRGGDDWEERLVAVFHRLTKLEPPSVRAARLEDWERAHREFHQALIGACGMPLLLQFCDVLHDLCDRYRHAFLATYPKDRDVHTEHRAILEAALARKAERAATLMRRHIARTGINVRRAMNGTRLSKRSPALSQARKAA